MSELQHSEKNLLSGQFVQLSFSFVCVVDLGFCLLYFCLGFVSNMSRCSTFAPERLGMVFLPLSLIKMCNMFAFVSLSPHIERKRRDDLVPIKN